MEQRLIDADALKAKVPNTNVDIFENCRNCSTLMDWEVKELIDKQPTIEERKTGRWEMWKWYTSSGKNAWTEEYKCSVCKYKYGEPEWNFCPNCGAKMREEQADECM